MSVRAVRRDRAPRPEIANGESQALRQRNLWPPPELARCLALRPDLLITDELFSGLSSSEVASIVPLIEKLQSQGMTLIMVEHRLRELFRLANRVVVIDRGRKIAEGTPAQIVDNHTVKETYLGAEL